MRAGKWCVLLCIAGAMRQWMPHVATPSALILNGLRPKPFVLDEAIDGAAREHKVPKALIRSIIAAESGFQPDAASQKGAIGYMQLMPETAQELGYDATDKRQNILAGSKYLSFLLERYKGRRNGLQRAIAAYNAGPGNVDRYKGIPPFRQTRTYVKRVMALHSEYVRAANASTQPEVSAAGL